MRMMRWSLCVKDAERLYPLLILWSLARQGCPSSSCCLACDAAVLLP